MPSWVTWRILSTITMWTMKSSTPRTSFQNPSRPNLRHRAKAKPKVVTTGKGRVKIVVRVEADGYVPTGKVRVRVAGKVYRALVVDGKAVVKLKKIGKPERTIATLSESASTLKAAATHTEPTTGR